jgi:hypothetical protein
LTEQEVIRLAKVSQSMWTRSSSRAIASLLMWIAHDLVSSQMSDPDAAARRIRKAVLKLFEPLESDEALFEVLSSCVSDDAVNLICGSTDRFGAPSATIVLVQSNWGSEAVATSANVVDHASYCRLPIRAAVRID